MTDAVKCKWCGKPIIIEGIRPIHVSGMIWCYANNEWNRAQPTPAGTEGVLTPEQAEATPCDWYGHRLSAHQWWDTVDGYQRCANCKNVRQKTSPTRPETATVSKDEVVENAGHLAMKAFAETHRSTPIDIHKQCRENYAFLRRSHESLVKALHSLASVETDKLGWRGGNKFIDGKWIECPKDCYSCEFCNAPFCVDSSKMEHEETCLLVIARAALDEAQKIR